MHRLAIEARTRTATSIAIGLCGLLVLVLVRPLNAGAPRTEPQVPQQAPAEKDRATEAQPEEIAAIDVLKGLHTGQLSASAEGNGDGRMILSLTNRTRKKLRVILPPGLIASGATGQFGGMGGMMGGMGGGMGMMGGGMGGMMGGGMGMMGGGMGGGMGMMGGGMGGGMGMRGGGMGMRGGMMGGGTMPASMGMMMLGRLIMSLVGDRDSWDQRSLMMGMMMMGGRGMMGGGMGMMGGGMGGMGGGFRSIPPTALPETTLSPRQTRHLPTVIVSLNGPGPDSRPMVAPKGEPLRISGIDDATDDVRTRTALKRLAAGKVPPSISQMVLWYIVAGADWDDIGRLSQGWGNAHEISLARQFVAHLDEPQDDTPGLHDPGRLYYEIKADGVDAGAVAESLRKFWRKYQVLGLTAVEGVPERPSGSALACRLHISATSADVKFASSHPSGSDWIPHGEMRLKRDDPEATAASASAKTAAATPPGDGETVATSTERAPVLSKYDRAAIRIGDGVAEGLVARLVRVRITHGPRVKGQESFKIKILNDSPLILNGLALGNAEVSSDNPPSVLAGMNLAPSKSMTVPASGEVVRRLRLKAEGRILAADLSGL